MDITSEKELIYNRGGIGLKRTKTAKSRILMLTLNLCYPYEEAPKQEKNHEDETETQCGIFGCYPSFLQYLASKKTYVLVYGLIGMNQFAMHTYNNATLTTIEKRFKIPSRMSGLITGSWEIGTLFSSIILAYIGSKSHKTRWVAVGSIICTISCFGRLIPHLCFNPAEDINASESKIFKKSVQSSSICGPGSLFEEDCSDGGISLMPAYILMALQILLGIGTATYWTLGVAYLDDNVRKNKMPLLLAMASCLRMIGPTIGFLIAAYALKIYVDPSIEPDMNPEDPRWIGAWWLGWIPIGITCLAMGLIIALFPRILPRAVIRKQQSSKEKTIQDEISQRSIKDFIRTIKRLMNNPVLTYNSMSSVFYILGMIGYWTFMPKYIETQFRTSASEASFYTGAIGLIFTAIGVCASGTVISKLKPRPRILAAWNVFVELLDVVGYMSFAFIGCPAEDLHGSWKSDGSWNLNMSCNAGCNCGLTVKYEPICSIDKTTTFYSPCHAGCTDVAYINGTKMFTNCSCIPNSGMATESFCPVDCNRNFIIFVVILCVLRFFSSSGRAGNTIIQIRAVPSDDKAIAIGFTELLLCALAFIPGPILYGLLLDSACLVWGQTCGSTGNCWLYDGQTLRYYLNFTASGFILLATLLDCGVWYHVKDLQIYDEDIKEEEIKADTVL